MKPSISKQFSPSPIEIIYACHPSIYSAVVLNHLLSSPHVRVLGVFESTCIKRRDVGFIRDALDLIRVSGLPYAVYLLLITSVFSGIAALMATPSVQQLCKKHNIVRVKTANINNATTIKSIYDQLAQKQLVNTFFVTVMFNQKISAQVLAINNLHFINMHPGQLPAYRGVDPVLAAMNNTEPHGVVTLHKLADELDTGDLLVQQSVALTPRQTLFDANMQFYLVGAKMLLTYLTGLGQAQENILQQGVPQQGQARYFTWPSSADVAKQSLFTWSDWRVLIQK